MDPVVKYCRSIPKFVSHAQELTPAACKAIRNWRSGCACGLGPDSSLGELVHEQEEAYASTNDPEPRSNTPITPEALSEASIGEDQVSELNPMVTTFEADSARMMMPFVRGVLSPKVSCAPSSPQALLIPENLFRVIRDHFEDSCRRMKFDEGGILLSSDGAEWRNDLCSKFDSYCFTATMLKEKGLHVDFRHTLERAFALVKPILQIKHPRTLACFFEVLIHFIQTGLPEVAFTLLGFVQGMSAEISGKDNVWSRIFKFLNELDRVYLCQTMAQCWRCTTDVVDGSLGPIHRFAVSVRLDYIKRVLVSNQAEEELLLRDLLAQLRDPPGHPTPRVMLNLAHNLNRQGRHNEAEKVALDVWYMLQHHGIYAERKVERIESLKVISRSQFAQNKVSEAERTIRMAIQIIVNQLGHQHPWVSEFMIVLEGWLRDWGREQDSNALQDEIYCLARQDVGEEMI